jgi:hypothetical protein
MNTNKRVFAFEVLRPFILLTTNEIWMSGAINGSPSIDDLAETGGELLISCVSGCPEGISSNRWNSIIVKMRYARWLMLMLQSMVSISALNNGSLLKVCLPLR